MSIIRDAEIENYLKEFTKKIFEASNINPDTISVSIVNDNKINAFVAKGNNLFIYTGLLTQSETPEQIIGVVAHELGHIVGGHLVRLEGQNKKTSTAMLLSTLAGGLAMIASGRSDVGSAVAMGGMSSSMGSYFNYRRSEENSADLYATKVLEETGESSLGLLQFMKKINHNDALLSNNQDPYFRTHPLTPERISFLDNFVKSSKYTNKPSNPDFVRKHQRLVTKLKAFLDNPVTTLSKYPKEDVSLIARYARAIAYYRQLKTNDSLKELDSLLTEFPNDPYFNELKGQILFEGSKINDSVPYYQKAVDNLSNNPLLMYGLASALIETNNTNNINQAISYLRKVVDLEKDNSGAWRLMANGYGRLNDMGKAWEATAEYSFIIGDTKMAELNAKKAIDVLAKDSPSWIRMKDILQETNFYNKKD
ncbi:MAG: M48 family metalloprotease [Alphaproteobacteria bacterium]